MNPKLWVTHNSMSSIEKIEDALRLLDRIQNRKTSIYSALNQKTVEKPTKKV